MAQIRKDVIPLAAQVRPQQLGLEDDAVSGWLDVSQLEAVQLLAQAGDLDSGTVAITFEQTSPDVAGDPDAGAKKALSAWTGGTLSVDGSALQVDNDPSKLDINNGFKFARMVMTSDDGADTGPTVSGALLGLSPRVTDAFTAAGTDTPGEGPAAPPP